MPDFKVAVLIDGGFLRVVAKKAKKHYDPDFIEALLTPVNRRMRVFSVSSTTTAQCTAAP